MRHDSLAKLTALEAAVVLWVEVKLKDPLNLPLYTDPSQASVGGSTVPGSTVLREGATLACVLGQPKAKLPDACAQGDVLRGELTCVKKALDASRPKGWPITFVVGLPPVKKDKAEPAKAPGQGKAMESETAKLASAVLELKIKALATMKEDADFAPLLAAVAADAPPEHLPLLRASLARALLCQQPPAAVAAAADAVLAAVDAPALAAALGMRAVDEDAEADLRKGLADQKAALVEALTHKAKAAHAVADTPGAEAADKDAAAAALRALQQWEEVSAAGKAKELAPLALVVLKAKGAGAVLKYCTAALAELAATADEGAAGPLLRAEKTAAMVSLGWGWVVEHDKVWELVNSPKCAALF